MRQLLGVAFMAAILAGCATGGVMDYLNREYGSAPSDGVVSMGEGEQAENYKIWIHKSKPKIVVQPPLSAAVSTGFAKGATFGAVDVAPVQPIFEQAGLKYLSENKGPGCKLSHPVKIHKLIWEFDYDCTPPQVAPLRKLGR